MTKDKTTTGIWVGQPLHFICLVLLLVLVYLVWNYLGEPFPILFWGAVAAPVVHQIYVWLSWRLELRRAAISKTIGFRGYVVIFFVLFSGRFISLLALAWADRGSLNLSILLVAIVTMLLAVPGIYAMYSVNRYFGMARAAGADHFDSKYRNMPLVEKGIFRFTNNGMYLYAFLLFWAIAVGFNSSAALAVAAFSHVYIGVHFYATEKPDMDLLYNAANKRMQSDATEPRR
jgi:phospholipid methyltransferase